MVPVIAPGFHRHRLAGALDHDDMFDGGAAFEGLVDDVLQLDDLAVHEAAIAGDDDVGLAVIDAAVHRFDREAAVDHRVDRADLGAGQHGDGQFGDAAHVDGHAVAFLYAHAAQDVGEHAHFAAEGVV